MISASKAILIALSLLAVAGGVLVVGPQEWRDLLTGKHTGAPAVAAKPDTKVEPKAAAGSETKGEARTAASKTETGKAETGTPGQTDVASAAKPAAPAKVAEAPAAVTAPSPAAPSAAAPVGSALAATEKQANAALGDLASSKPLAKPDSGPSFDVARIGEGGDAVIAGRAAPGARVELLRDGMPLDTVVADSSGQFVMTPPTLPGGRYELSLRAKSPDGTVAQSSRTVPVTLAEAAPPAPPRASIAAPAPAAPRLAAALATAPPAETPTGTLHAARGDRIVIRGDSLWAISRRAYGDGARYSLIFNANRTKIQNPDLIYPGQAFVLPRR